MSDLFGDQAHAFTLDQMIACAERELSKRMTVYPKLCKPGGGMTEAKAKHETECMRAILDNLKGQRR